jgi:hypothetical protein
VEAIVTHKRKEKSQIDKHIQLKADIVLAGPLATFRRKIAAGGADVGIAAFAENCKVGRI